MRGALLAGLLAWAAVAHGQHYQYRVLIGDRDAERGVLYYDYPTGNFGALGICDPSPNANDFYYGVAIHHERGEIWVCNVLRNRIDVLDFEGNCLYQLHGQSSQLPPSLRFPPASRGEPSNTPTRFPLRAGGT